MTAPRPGDTARAQVLVEVAPDDAFRIFHEDLEAWWRRGLAYRVSRGDRGLLHLEPWVGGRLFESVDVPRSVRGEPASTAIVTGRVLAWDPPRRMLLEWRGVNFAPGERTEIDVRFEASRSGTLVTVTHTGWAALRPDHPVRHGRDVPAFVRAMGLFWGELLTSLREHARPHEPGEET